jgi:hypothetical protein
MRPPAWGGHSPSTGTLTAHHYLLVPDTNGAMTTSLAEERRTLSVFVGHRGPCTI